MGRKRHNLQFFDKISTFNLRKQFDLQTTPPPSFPPTKTLATLDGGVYAYFASAACLRDALV